MSASGMPARSQRLVPKRVTSVASLRPAKRALGQIAKPDPLKTAKPQPRNGNGAFDAETFLARAGLGRTILRLKKSEVAYAQGDPADAIFYVQKGQLRVTVTSANGKEATISSGGRRRIPGGELHDLSSSSSTLDCYRDDRVCAAQD